MINVCFADNYPVVHQGVNTYFVGHPRIAIFNNSFNYAEALSVIEKGKIDVLVIDLELDGLNSIYELRVLMRKYPKLKVLVYSALKESVYAPNVIKAGMKGYVHKSNSVEYLDYSIEKVFHDEIIINEDLQNSLLVVASQPKSDRSYKKLSYREVEVLRYLSEGRKNNEISKILNLNEKTISTYKLRLQSKLGVTNLVDLVNKAKTMEIL